MDRSATIRLATQDDIPAIVAIYNQAILRGGCTADTDPIDPIQWQHWLDIHPADKYPVWVAVDSHAVVGWVSISAWRPGRKALVGVAEVSYYVHNDFQGRGIGQQLLLHAIRHMETLQLHTILAILLGVNSRSITLLEKHGFTRWGTLPGVARFTNSSSDQVIYGLREKV